MPFTEENIYIYIYKPSIKSISLCNTRFMVTYCAEPWSLSNTMESLCSMGKENIEKNVWSNI
jgi:hypothetical protein